MATSIREALVDLGFELEPGVREQANEMEQFRVRCAELVEPVERLPGGADLDGPSFGGEHEVHVAFGGSGPQATGPPQDTFGSTEKPVHDFAGVGVDDVERHDAARSRTVTA